MHMSPYLNFNGNCEAAFRYYEKVLGANIQMMLPHEGTPAASHTPAEWQKKILHARMAIGNQIIMGSDAPPGFFQTPQGFSISLEINNAADAERIFNALAVNGRIKMPLAQTFFAHRFGMLVDQFGIPWMINCEKPE